ncbi:DMT family transporter [Parachitinimonas caeni]|uniref:EamA family transporter n=1 Tax=Parachitinimonas caeni TaxID=3031301 RepID=A0ABT7DX44_9NEIS|nr:EamA family transporter [Parachitinimonas caeni]MDK2124635.1 EamA family transporter [Parachitinimonas caeni]
MPSYLLYLITVVIWGSTWLAITFQYGTVPTSASVAYRFLLAGSLLLIWCAAKGEKLAFRLREHGWMATQGLFLFGLNYMLVYQAERYVSSGLVAVLFSVIVVLNLVGMRLAFGKPISRRSVLGAAMGTAGVALVFWPELTHVNGENAWLGVGIGLASTCVASLGNLVSQRNQQAQLPLLPTIGFGMLYGGTASVLYTLASGQSLTFDTSLRYISSLVYLSIFGSIIAFAAYLTLVGRIGAAKAAYSIVLTPIIALLLSSLFEGYVWHLTSFAGIALCLAGNVVMQANSDSGRQLMAALRSLRARWLPQT